MNNFYRLSHNSFGTRGIPWMRGVRYDFVNDKCSYCGNSRIKKPKGIILLEPETSKGTFWPDVIGEGSGTVSKCVSETVKTDWDNAGIKYGKAWEAKVLEPYPKKLQGTAAPVYYWIQGPNGIKLDYEASGYTNLTECHKCGRIRGTSPDRPKPYVFVPDSWDGSDVFGRVKSSLELFCTQRVLDLAIEKRWTNFEFTPINTPLPAEPIPYLKISKKLSK